jgi:peptide deformylase
MTPIQAVNPQNNKLKLIAYPNPILRSKALPINLIDDRIKDIAHQMVEIMYESKGIGLAANQVGILDQIIVVDLRDTEDSNPLIILNPIITKLGNIGEKYEEGCLSLPYLIAPICRPDFIELDYLGIDGEKT